MSKVRSDLNSFYIKKKNKGVTLEDKDEIKKLYSEYIKIHKLTDIISVKKTDRILSEILSFFTPLLKTMSAKYTNNTKDVNVQKDILSEAYHGLLYGIKKFNPSFGTTISTYVYYWVERYMQKYTIERKSIVKNNSLYHPLLIFIRDLLSKGINQEEIYTYFPPAKDNTKSSIWFEIPNGLNLKNKYIKKDTIKKHIDAIINENDNFTVFQNQTNNNYLELKTFDLFIKEDPYVQVKKDKTKELNDKIYSVICGLKNFSNTDKNIFIEFNDLSVPLLLIDTPINNDNKILMSIMEKQKINKNNYLSLKYNVDKTIIKKVVTNIMEEIKFFFEINKEIL